MPRNGQAPEKLTRAEFHNEFKKSFIDPAFLPVKDALDKMEEVAWKNYHEGGHKAPLMERAGSDFFDPDYELSSEWKQTRQRLIQVQAESKQKESDTRSRVLLICASVRNDGSCASDISKSWQRKYQEH